jgi:hypothetical protein
VEALDGNESRFVVAVAGPRRETRLLASATNRATRGEQLSRHEVLLQLPTGTTIDAVSIR